MQKDKIEKDIESKFTEVPPEKVEEVEKLEKELAQKKEELKEIVKIPEVAEKIKEELPEKEEMPYVVEEGDEEKQVALAKVIEEKLKKLYTTNPPKKDDKFDIDSKRIKKLSTREDQVEALVHLAYSKNFLYAISLAQKLKDSFVLDTLHDILRDWLFQMVKRKKP